MNKLHVHNSVNYFITRLHQQNSRKGGGCAHNLKVYTVKHVLNGMHWERNLCWNRQGVG